MNIERRDFAIDDVQVVTRDDDGGNIITGHAAVFNRTSENLGGFVERIAPGAFKGSLNDNIFAYWNHNSDIVLGRTSNDTLSLTEDDKGLAFELKPNFKTQSGSEAFEQIRSGAVDQMSFGFFVEDPDNDQEWERGEDGAPDVRTLKRVRLVEVSPVSRPAYLQTDVGVRDESLAYAVRSHETWRAGLEADLKVEAEALEAAFELLEDETPVVDTKDRDRKVKLMEMET